jgi:hypothetical protein
LLHKRRSWTETRVPPFFGPSWIQAFFPGS